jgi:hypothetical protein
MMRVAETSTGTPCKTSLIWRPDLTSFTDNASSVYLRGHIHCNHRSTWGIEFRWTKKPANVIWYRAVKALRRIARPPSVMAKPRRKFFEECQLDKERRKHESERRKTAYKERHAYSVKYKDE